MADLTANDLILIVAVSGFIAISVYAIFLENKLLSRVLNVEREFRNSQKEVKKLGLELDKLGAIVQEIGETKEVLQATGKDIDLINLRMEAFGRDLLRVTQKLGELENGFSNKNEIKLIPPPENISLPNLVNSSTVTKKLGRLEPESFEGPPQEEF
ncbi:MAG: hypothetical protein OK457_04105 [Thaumarchaeota archaeon]|nr:hypothetical protein [Nitrososphaerota archaeon]